MKKLIFTFALFIGTIVLTNAQSSQSVATDGSTQVTSGGTTIKPEMTAAENPEPSCGSKSKASGSGCCSSKKANTEASAKKACCSSGEAKKSGCIDKAHGNDEMRKEKD
jgi:hypothetical protein